MIGKAETPALPGREAGSFVCGINLPKKSQGVICLHEQLRHMQRACTRRENNDCSPH